MRLDGVTCDISRTLFGVGESALEGLGSALGYPIFFFCFIDRVAVSILPYQPTDVPISFIHILYTRARNLIRFSVSESREETNTYNVLFYQVL